MSEKWIHREPVEKVYKQGETYELSFTDPDYIYEIADYYRTVYEATITPDVEAAGWGDRLNIDINIGDDGLTTARCKEIAEAVLKTVKECMGL